MESRRIRLVLAGGVLVLAALLVLIVSRSRRGPAWPGVPASRAQAPSVAGSVRVGQAPAADADAGGRSQLADDLNSAKGDVHSDLRLVDGIFNAYRSALRTGNPIGDNAEITAALTGRNKLDFAFIPAGHPAINSKGELCDRWGTPYFFHQLSGEKMEIRSAGPDRQLWTADDEVLTP